MEIPTVKQVAELLDRVEYRVVINRTDGGCLTHFPTRVEIPLMDFQRLYQEFTSEGILTCTHDETGAELEQVVTDCPPYAQRLFTLYQVIYHCMGIGYELAFIKFAIDGEEVHEEAFFQTHTSPWFGQTDDIVNENKLRQILGICLHQGFTPQLEMAAKQASIHEGFCAVRSIFLPDQQMPPELLQSWFGETPDE